MNKTAMQYIKDEEPRVLRARRFASTILHLMKDFLPTAVNFRQRAYEHLADAALKFYVEIV